MGHNNYAKRALLDLEGALLCLQEEALWVLKGALLHSSSKSGGHGLRGLPGSYIPDTASRDFLVSLLVYQIIIRMYISYYLAANCGDPGAFHNGHIDGNSFKSGDRLNFSCNHGYEMIGRSSSVCDQSTARWKPEIPRCNRKLSCYHFYMFDFRADCTSIA